MVETLNLPVKFYQSHFEGVSDEGEGLSSIETSTWLKLRLAISEGLYLVSSGKKPRDTAFLQRGPESPLALHIDWR